MLEEAMIANCAPTLAGLKTGNAFSVMNIGPSVINEISEIDHRISQKGLRLLPIRFSEKNLLIYLYRPSRLRKDLCTPEAVDILSGKGYCCNDPELCLCQLIKHLNEDADFPHEIGLFLGYPPYDVKCFMKDPCRGVKCLGCWKSYGDPEEAVKTFDRFKRCAEAYKKQAAYGKSLEDLIVVDPEDEHILRETNINNPKEGK